MVRRKRVVVRTRHAGDNDIEAGQQQREEEQEQQASRDEYDGEREDSFSSLSRTKDMLPPNSSSISQEKQHFFVSRKEESGFSRSSTPRSAGTTQQTSTRLAVIMVLLVLLLLGISLYVAGGLGSSAVVVRFGGIRSRSEERSIGNSRASATHAPQLSDSNGQTFFIIESPAPARASETRPVATTAPVKNILTPTQEPSAVPPKQVPVATLAPAEPPAPPKPLSAAVSKSLPCGKEALIPLPESWRQAWTKPMSHASMEGVVVSQDQLNKPTVKVLYTFCNVTEGNRERLFVSMKSMVLFSDRSRLHDIFVITNADEVGSLSSVTQRVIDMAQAPNFKFHVLAKNFSRPSDNYYAPCAGARLFVYKDLPSLDKVIYLDVDTLILKPISELFDMFGLHTSEHMFSFADEALGYGSSSLDTLWFNKTSGTNGKAPWPRFNEKGLNSGVILMDFAKQRQSDYSSAMEKFMQKWLYPEDVRFADQDYFNMFCGTYVNRCATMPCNWNYRVRTMFDSCQAECGKGLGIIHGTNGMMPLGDIYEVLSAIEKREYDPNARGGWLIFTQDTLKIIYNSVRICVFNDCPTTISGNLQKVVEKLYGFHCNPINWQLPGGYEDKFAQSRERCLLPSGVVNIMMDKNTCRVPVMMCRIIGNMWKTGLLVKA